MCDIRLAVGCPSSCHGRWHVSPLFRLLLVCILFLLGCWLIFNHSPQWPQPFIIISPHSKVLQLTTPIIKKCPILRFILIHNLAHVRFKLAIICQITPSINPLSSIYSNPQFSICVTFCMVCQMPTDSAPYSITCLPVQPYSLVLYHEIRMSDGPSLTTTPEWSDTDEVLGLRTMTFKSLTLIRTPLSKQSWSPASFASIFFFPVSFEPISLTSDYSLMCVFSPHCCQLSPTTNPHAFEEMINLILFLGSYLVADSLALSDHLDFHSQKWSPQRSSLQDTLLSSSKVKLETSNLQRSLTSPSIWILPSVGAPQLFCSLSPFGSSAMGGKLPELCLLYHRQFVLLLRTLLDSGWLNIWTKCRKVPQFPALSSITHTGTFSLTWLMVCFFPP